LGGRKGIRPVKKLSGVVLAWLSVWREVKLACGPADSTAAHCLFLQFDLSGTGSPRQMAIKRMYVCYYHVDASRSSPSLASIPAKVVRSADARSQQLRRIVVVAEGQPSRPVVDAEIQRLSQG